MDSYEKSNSIEKLPEYCVASNITKKLFVSLRNKPVTNQKDLQLLADTVCIEFNVAKVNVIFGGVQNNTQVNGKLKSKTLGTYYTNSANIRIFEFTAVRKKEIAPKTAFDTLLHELMHHFDYTILGLRNSLHTSGFYKRIGYLKEMLLSQ